MTYDKTQNPLQKVDHVFTFALVVLSALVGVSPIDTLYLLL
tara:strand:+ start:131 stop:253 length:123 start_codon:yes stop_codon:yes gene_type:complete